MPPETATDPSAAVEAEIHVQTDGPVAVITLNRPGSANAIDQAMASQLREAWISVRDDATVRAIIVTGAGSRHFCVGADLKFVAATGTVPSRGRMNDPEPPWTPMANEVWKPVISVVNGIAAGGGLHLVSEADIVVAEPRAAFLDSHVNVGMVGAIENVQLLDRLPLGAVMMMTLVGRGFRLTAQRAHELGLVDVLAEEGAAMAEAFRLANLIAQNSPSAVMASKRAVWHAVRSGRAERVSLGWQLLQQQWEHPDFAEGAAAFVEGRAPRWAPPSEPGQESSGQ